MTLRQGKMIVNGNANIYGTIDWKSDANNTPINSTAGNMIFYSGSAYNHYAQGGAFPIATWRDGSTATSYGENYWSTQVPANLNQNFYNFIWNWANQGTNLDLNGALKTIRGAFLVTNTNGKQLNLNASGTGHGVYVDSLIDVTNGMLLTGKDTIYLSSEGKIAEGAANYILGTLVTSHKVTLLNTDYTFGNLGLTLNFHGALPGEVRVIRINTNVITANGAQSIQLHYIIGTDVTNGLDATMTMSYRDNELNGHMENTLVFFSSKDFVNWLNKNISTRNTANNTLTLNGINSFNGANGTSAGLLLLRSLLCLLP